MMIWSPSRVLSARDLVRAGIFTAVIPVALAFTFYWLAPWGCDANAWLCLLPLALIYVSPIAALILPLAFLINRRRQSVIPDGWLSTMILTGIVAQLLVTVTSLWLNEPHIRRIFFFDVLIFPQGFVAGATIGAIFWVSLAAFGKATQGR
jgi:hypothetical protein